jgi:hypothetical protein
MTKSQHTIKVTPFPEEATGSSRLGFESLGLIPNRSGPSTERLLKPHSGLQSIFPIGQKLSKCF